MEFMKTKQEQIEEMHKVVYKTMRNTRGFTSATDIATALVQAGYGDVSEYKAEREMLGSKIKVLEQRLNNKYIEIDNLNRDYSNSFERLKAQGREITRLKAEVKQAQIDVLNELKERIETAIDTYYNSDGGGYYLAEDVLDDVDELIEEVENEQKE